MYPKIRNLNLAEYEYIPKNEKLDEYDYEYE